MIPEVLTHWLIGGGIFCLVLRSLWGKAAIERKLREDQKMEIEKRLRVLEERRALEAPGGLSPDEPGVWVGHHGPRGIS